MADSLNKTELVAAVAAESGQSQATVSGVVDASFSVIADAVGKGTKVSIPAHRSRLFVRGSWTRNEENKVTNDPAAHTRMPRFERSP